MSIIYDCCEGILPSHHGKDVVLVLVGFTVKELYKAAKLWDALPRKIKDSNSKGELKQLLKLHYLHFVNDFYLT